MSDRMNGGGSDQYVFVISGLALILVAILAPEGITGLVRRQTDRFLNGSPG